MPVIRNLRYRNVPRGKGERVYQEMALAMQNAGQCALTIDLTKVELSALRYYPAITHLTIKGGGKNWQLEGLPPSLQDLCLLEVELDTLTCLETLTDLRVFDHRFGNIHNADGLKKCAALQALNFLHLPGLHDLDFLPALPKLEWLKICLCINVKRFPALTSLRSLRRVVIERCQGLLDLSAFTSAPNLEDLIVLETESIDASQFKSIAASEHPKRVLPGIGLLGSPEVMETLEILADRVTTSYYGGTSEFFEIRHRRGDREFMVKLS